jgi:N-acetylmuramic acid 6-phosphate etherase
MSTESADPRFVDVDRWPTEIAVEAMLEGQLMALAALRSQVAAIAAAAEAAAIRLRDGGQLVYVGAGTSGRVAVQDGVELAPTYGWPEERLVFLLAGGEAALARSVEGAEDDAPAARAAVAGASIGRDDVVIAVAASGRTPYTVAALQEARARGALAIGIANNAGTPLLAAADHPIFVETGAEIVAGSTRMKAGTAQKAGLNMLSTAIMLRCGLVYRGLMVNMRVSNEKLEQRARRMVAQIARVGEVQAADALAASGNDIKQATLVAWGISPVEARERLERSHGNLRDAFQPSAEETHDA